MAKLAKFSDRKAVLKALAEYDRMGQDGFLRKYNFGKALNHLILHNGRRYDSKAIFGRAFTIQFPAEPLTTNSFGGGIAQVVRPLRALGFEVTTLKEMERLKRTPGGLLADQLALDAQKAEEEGLFDPQSVQDGREKAVRSVTLRRGQLEFRRKLLNAYGGRCAISSCDCEDALEAAHIVGYKGKATNHIQNGLLLRSDLHTLFDLRKIGIDPVTLTVVVDESIINTVYREWHGKPLRQPKNSAQRPNKEALERHLRGLDIAALGVSIRK
ncbi:HNH endonuclease [Paludibaculum fermentans]|uniref:HNH endonuclease n=1 Tax=Paludibaculum fermentans TaxID=1473598 RepID=UPI003EB6981A